MGTSREIEVQGPQARAGSEALVKRPRVGVLRPSVVALQPAEAWEAPGGAEH